MDVAKHINAKHLICMSVRKYSKNPVERNQHQIKSAHKLYVQDIDV